MRLHERRAVAELTGALIMIVLTVAGFGLYFSVFQGRIGNTSGIVIQQYRVHQQAAGEMLSLAYSSATASGTTVYVYNYGSTNVDVSKLILTGFSGTNTQPSSWTISYYSGGAWSAPSDPSALTAGKLNRIYVPTTPDVPQKLTIVTNSYAIFPLVLSPITSPAALAVYVSPTGVGIDPSQTIALKANPTGGAGSYGYQWYSDSACTAPITGATSQTYAASPASSSTYCVKVSDGAGSTAKGTGTVTLNPALAAGAITPAAPSIDSGQTVTLTAHPSGGTGPYTYQWSTGSGCASPISGATSSGYTSGPLTSTTVYSYSVGDSSLGTPAASACSSADTVTVVAGLSVSTSTTSTPAIDSGQQFSASATFSGGVGPYTCQWLQEAPGSGSFSNLGSSFACTSPASKSAALTTVGAWHFELQVTDSAPTPMAVTSGAVAVTVNAALAVPVPTVGLASVNLGSSTTLTGTFSGGTPAYTCQWLVEAPGSSSYINLGTASSCTSPASTSTGLLGTAGTWSFELKVTDSASTPTSVTSNPVTVTVKDFSVTGPGSVSFKASKGGTATITVAAINGFTGTVSLTASPTSGLTAVLNPTSVTLGTTGTSTLTLSAAATGTYSVTISATSGGITHTLTITVTVT